VRQIGAEQALKNFYWVLVTGIQAYRDVEAAEKLRFRR
jgi:hypothetical protein